MAKRGQILRQTSRQTPLGPTKESKMGAPSPNLCNPLAGFSAEKRLELPAVEIMARSLVVKGVGRTKFASHGPSTCTAVFVTLLSLLAAAGAATAQELSVHQPVIPASDPVPQQLEQGRKPANHFSQPERGAPEVIASGFDPATLPPIESIDAQTDITAFLQNDVPEKLRLAALRRAWTVDPAIRDLMGLLENDWNFNDPNSTPGFGELAPRSMSKEGWRKFLVRLRA
jgi:hypothetical protein